MKLEKVFLIEVVVKNIACIVVFITLLLPGINYEFEALKTSEQGSVLTVLGFLMAASIIGAFELSYAKTHLNSLMHRMLAHSCKFMVYLAVCSLLWIAHKTMEVSDGYFTEWISLSSLLIFVSLVLYDFWDSCGALKPKS
ncbi:hypothetical protein MHO82_21485 [Vibrio sp. Of7-15]|uniref:hypothetical protein n=1 Tax=Vibrio sp. Of7-15 TaxID=2724879 RepID=UPI001EF2DC79|nr:hypothetical protein [Vibrio sp. Of7-15]MCG7499444.1 hypothetical protein [Vibrio sp. Of7-15]